MVLPDGAEQPPEAAPYLAPALPGYNDEEVPDDVSSGISIQPPDPAGGSSIELRSAIAQAHSTYLAPPPVSDPALEPTPDPIDTALGSAMGRCSHGGFHAQHVGGHACMLLPIWG